MTKTPDELRAIRNMGAKSVNEIIQKTKDYVSDPKNQNRPSPAIREPLSNREKIELDPVFKTAVEALLTGDDYTTEGLSEKQCLRLEELKEAAQIIGEEICLEAYLTIAARVERNGGKPLAILCKVYLGLSESDEATLFAEQNGFSADLTAGVKLRALIYAGDPLACSFQKATEGTGISLDFSQQGGTKRLACIATAFNEYRKIGPEKYKEALTILLEAWDGAFDSLRAESVSAMCEFVDLYEGEYDRKRLIRRFRGYDPINIFRKGRAMGDNMPGYKKYLYQVWAMYNGTSVKSALPLKF